MSFVRQRVGSEDLNPDRGGAELVARCVSFYWAHRLEASDVCEKVTLADRAKHSKTDFRGPAKMFGLVPKICLECPTDIGRRIFVRNPRTSSDFWTKICLDSQSDLPPSYIGFIDRD